jgi:hypothetical protein
LAQCLAKQIPFHNLRVACLASILHNNKTVHTCFANSFYHVVSICSQDECNKGRVTENLREAQIPERQQSKPAQLPATRGAANCPRYALTVDQRTRHGLLCHWEYIYVWIAPLCTEISVYTSPLCDRPTLIVRCGGNNKPT